MLDEAKVKRSVEESKASPRMKTLLTERHAAAQTELKCRYEQYLAGRGTLDILIASSGRLLDADRDLSAGRKIHIEAWKKHVERLQEIEKFVKAQFTAGRASLADAAQAECARLTGEIGLERAREK
jgi:hypothetical protein